MSRVEVDPGSLRAAASDADVVAEVFRRVATSLPGDVDTGAGDSAAAADAALDELRRALHDLSGRARTDAVLLRFSVARYAAADHAAGGARCD